MNLVGKYIVVASIFRDRYHACEVIKQTPKTVVTQPLKAGIGERPRRREIRAMGRFGVHDTAEEAVKAAELLTQRLTDARLNYSDQVARIINTSNIHTMQNWNSM